MNQTIKKFLIRFFSKKEERTKISLILVGLASTIWFLLRVIPKPSRAGYPCMTAAAPFMSAFLIWLGGTLLSTILIKKSKQLFLRSKFFLATILAVSAMVLALLTFTANEKEASAKALFSEADDYPPNAPMGTALDLYPGRVVWTWNPDATDEYSSMTVNKDGIIDRMDDVFFLPVNNDPEVINNMIAFSIQKLTETSDNSIAWDNLFRFHNKRKNNTDKGYSADETVYIKTNFQGVGLSHIMNEDLSQSDLNVWGSFPPHMTATSPYPILATIDQLVNEANVPEENIYMGDPHNNINNIYYDIINSEFPNVKIIGINSDDVKDCEDFGRTLSIKSEKESVFFSDKKTVLAVSSDRLYKQLEEADYIINIAALKSHIRGGISLFCKSHFGSHTRSSAAHMHPGLPSPDKGIDNFGYGKYRVLVDLMGNEHLGGNTMLYILDGLWGGKPHELHEPRKWDMLPFNGDWTSSIFMSIDPVAIASVGFDFLRTEYNVADWGAEAYPNYYGTDDYLHQAADPAAWPEGFVYDPENDGIPLESLGVHEHWNNADDKHYSRNIDPVNGTGIELLAFTKEDMINMSVESLTKNHNIRIYPNPASNLISIQHNYPSRTEMKIQIVNISGQVVFETHASNQINPSINIEGFEDGIYMICLEWDGFRQSEKLIIKH